MSDQNKVHIYDGIEEQNNPMPGWWVWLFIFTVIFGSIYWIHYTFGGGPTLAQEFKVEQEDFNRKLDAQQAAVVAETEESLTEFMKKESNLQAGAQIFSEKCAMCHGANLEGKIGPNLTDHFWINGHGTRMDLVGIVSKGVPAKGMPPWETMLKPNAIKSVVGYVLSKKDSHPANAKEPQGSEVKE
ncbi:MAG: cbb3-type cytochrome c oxidase N-terminal domain-containing protein [Pseudobdellovibrio sp.]